jgi:hypothetical protein
MAKERKMYAVKEDGGRIWQTELNLAEIAEICHEGAGTEMCDDKITICFLNGLELVVDKIVVK